MHFKVILESAQDELVVEKSRFIAHLKNVRSELEAQSFIESIKKKNYNAAHNVPVYRIGDEGQFQKFSDDGEPAGTAGMPVFELIKKEGLTDICIVITRYFGGIKLGTGGLVRAYTASAKSVLAISSAVQVSLFDLGQIKVDYGWLPTLSKFLEQSEVVSLKHLYEEEVTIEIACASDNWQTFKLALLEKTNGQIHCELKGQTNGIKENGHFHLYKRD